MKIIGQDALIKEVQKIFNIFKTSECELRPHFILTGESGSGKSGNAEVSGCYGNT